MNTLALTLLLAPLVASFLLLYPVYALLNPGNEIMTASNYTFQSDTFSARGTIGSASSNTTDPLIVTGRWLLDVQSGQVAEFSANLTMVNASGAGFRTALLSNLSSTHVVVENDTAYITGMVDIQTGAEKQSGVNATISLVKMRALNITLSEYLVDPVYGIAEINEETVTSTTTALLPEGSGVSGNISEKFKEPQLPNLFK